MNRKDVESIDELLGSVVTGSKPWNCEYNVGLVVDSNHDWPSQAIRIMWMNHKDAEVEKRMIHQVEGKYVYTWEHPTSVMIISRNECYG